MDIKAGRGSITILLKDKPLEAVCIAPDGNWKLSTSGATGSRFELSTPGVYTLQRIDNKQ
jgi:hypothetical protein